MSASIGMGDSPSSGQCDPAISEYIRQAIAERLERPGMFDVVLDIVTEETLSDLEISRQSEQAKALVKQQAEQYGLPFSFDAESYRKNLIEQGQSQHTTIRYARNGSQFHVSASLPMVRSGPETGDGHTSLPREARYNGTDLWEVDALNKAARSRVASGTAVAPFDALSRQAMEDADRDLFDADFFRPLQNANVLDCELGSEKVCVALDPAGTPYRDINLTVTPNPSEAWVIDAIRVVYEGNGQSAPLFAEISYDDMVEVDGVAWPSKIQRSMGEAPSSFSGLFCDADISTQVTYRTTIAISHNGAGSPPDPALFSFNPPADYTVQSEGAGGTAIIVQDPNMQRLEEQLAARKVTRKKEMEKARQDNIQSRLKQAGGLGALQWYLTAFGVLASAAGLILFWRTRK